MWSIGIIMICTLFNEYPFEDNIQNLTDIICKNRLLQLCKTKKRLSPNCIDFILDLLKN